MPTDHFRLALRIARRQPGYTLLNVAGLAVGLACCLLILLFVQDELRYDRHHRQAGRIYRVTASYLEDGRHWAPIGPPVAAALRARIPEIERTARVFPLGSGTVLRHEERRFEERNGVYADASIFDLFTFPLLRGDPATALRDPGTVVLSRRTARRYFGDADPLGRTLHLAGQGDLAVTGVMADPPDATHLPVDFMVSMATFYGAENVQWLESARTWAGFYSYVLLREGASVEAVRRKLPAFVDGFYEGVFERGRPAEQMALVLQPLGDIHLHSKLEKEYRPNGDVTYVYVFATVALFVLLVACVNFVNLMTARAANRVREVGVRKTLGAARSALVRQFMAESSLMVLLALVAAGVLIEFSLPLFNELAGKRLSVAAFLQPLPLAGAAGVVLLTLLVSGSYPALVLSSFRPVQALRGKGSAGHGSAGLRRALVVFQFATSVFLVASTIVVSRQFDFFRSRPLGFDREHVVVVHLSGEQGALVRRSPERVKHELTRHPAVRAASLASDYPGDRYSLESVRVEGGAEETQVRIAWGVDHDYLAALGIPLRAGRGFSKEAPADTSGWIINEAAARRLGLEEPLGKRLRWGDDYAGPIVGVARDFHFASLHGRIEPLVIPLRPGVGSSLIVRTAAGGAPEALSFVRRQLERFAPGEPFRYTYLDDGLAELYRAEERLGRVFAVFSVIAVVIACLGLFALSAYAAERRTKEIGIRKALGATVPGLVALLSKDFLKLVLLATLLATPLAWLAMDRWLQGFAYRIEIGPGAFLLAGALAGLIALLTVGYQSVRAARQNPVRTLRYE